MCTTDYDYPDVYVVREPVARKAHRCCECNSTIHPGEKYRYHFGVWDSRPSVFKSCKFCMIPQDWLKKECGTYMLGGLHAEIEEHAFEYRKIFLYRWVIGIRENWMRLKRKEVE